MIQGKNMETGDCKGVCWLIHQELTHAIIIINNMEKIKFFNKTAESIFGITEEKVKGELFDPFVSCLMPGNNLGISESIGGLNANGHTSFTYNNAVLKSSGDKVFPARVCITKVQSVAGTAEFVIFVHSMAEEQEQRDRFVKELEEIRAL